MMLTSFPGHQLGPQYCVLLCSTMYYSEKFQLCNEALGLPRIVTGKTSYPGPEGVGLQGSVS